MYLDKTTSNCPKIKKNKKICLFSYSGVQHILFCAFVFLRHVNPMLTVSLDCPFLIAPFIFSDVWIGVWPVISLYNSPRCSLQIKSGIDDRTVKLMQWFKHKKPNNPTLTDADSKTTRNRNKKKNKYHNVETILKSNIKIVRTFKIDTPNTQIHGRSFSCLNWYRHFNKLWWG